MRSVMSNAQCRRLDFLTILYQKDDWVTIDTLINTLHCSETTLHADVEVLHEQFPEVHIDYNPGEFRLHFAKGTDMHIMSKAFLGDIPILTLVETILYKEVESLDGFSKKVGVSTSTLYRMLAALNKVLKEKFNIQIKGRPYYLDGDEVDIRYFYSQYFAERYAVIDWPFKGINEDFFNQFITYFMNFVEAPLIFANFRFVKIVTAVNLLRLKKGHAVSVQSTNLDKLYGLLTKDDQYHEISDKFKEQFDLEISKTVIENLFMAYIRDDFFYGYAQLYNKAMVDIALNRSRIYLTEMVKKLCSKYGLEISNLDSLVLNVHNTSFLERQLIGTTYLLYDRKENICQRLRQLHPDLFEDIKQGLIQFHQQNGQHVNTEMTNHLIYIFYTYWEGLIIQLEKNRLPVRVVVLSEYETQYTDMLVALIDYHTSSQIVVDTYPLHIFDKEYLQNSDYDLIVSNFHCTPIEGKTIIFIEDYVTDRDLQSIRSKVLEIERERTK